MKTARTYLLFVMVLLGFSLKAQETVILAAEDSWPPFAKSNGEGISKSIIEKAYAYSGMDVQFVIVPYARALNMAQAGEVDGAFNVTKQGSTEAKFHFGEEPLLRVSASFYYSPSSKLNYKSVSEIPEGTKIATILGYEYGDSYTQNQARFTESRVATQQQIVKLLLSGRVDMAIMFDEVASYTIDEMGFEQSVLRKGALNHTSEIYVAFNKKLKGSEKVRKLDLGLKAIRDESAFVTP
jgi:polar amino acid transport system substrate-binding protein